MSQYQFVTLVNRSSKPLNGTWDGRQHTIAPGQHQFPEVQALKFKEQNPIMGSEDPYTMQKEYLIGILEHNDDITPVEQTESIERWNRSKLIGAKPVEIVKGNGLYRPGGVDAENRLPVAGKNDPVVSTFDSK